MLPVNQMAFCMADHKTNSCCYAATSLLLCDDILGKVAGFRLTAGGQPMLMNATSSNSYAAFLALSSDRYRISYAIITGALHHLRHPYICIEIIKTFLQGHIPFFI